MQCCSNCFYRYVSHLSQLFVPWFLNLYRSYGKVVAHVEKQACSIDLVLPVSNKRNRVFWENGALWVLLSLCHVAERKSNARFCN